MSGCVSAECEMCVARILHVWIAGKGGCITMVEEYRFMLFRHWNLFDAMYHSEYVATRLGTWVNETAGRQKLNTMLVNMGIPVKESTQKCVACGLRWAFCAGCLPVPARAGRCAAVVSPPHSLLSLTVRAGVLRMRLSVCMSAQISAHECVCPREVGGKAAQDSRRV
jgi:hypothetical protein